MTDLRDLLAEYLGIAPQSGDEWTILCPSPDHSDHRPSASLYVGEPQERLRGGKKVLRLPGMWVCYSCHAAGRITNERIEHYEPSADRNLEVAVAQLDERELRVYPESWLGLFDYPGGVHPYWLERFREETALKHRLGYDYERDAGTYPFRSPDGQVLGVVRRSLDTETTGWKYRYPTGIDVHNGGYLYGYADAVRTDAQVVVVCEGALDAVACDEVGYAGLAIYGSRVSAAQVKMINRLYPKTIILAFDNDSAGQAAAEHFLAQEIDCADLQAVTLGGYKDIAEAPCQERAEILADTASCDMLYNLP